MTSPKLADDLVGVLNDLEDLHKKIEVSPVTPCPPQPKTEQVAAACSACRGICCKRFAITVPLTPDGKPDFSFHKELTPQELAFATENFVLVPQHGVGDGSEVRVEYTFSSGIEIFLLWLTCRAFDPVTNRCTRYEERPPACRKFICTEARWGKTPLVARLDRYERYMALLLDPGMDRTIERVVVDRGTARHTPICTWHEDWRTRYDALFPFVEGKPQDANADLSVQLEQSVSRGPVNSPDNVSSV